MLRLMTLALLVTSTLWCTVAGADDELLLAPPEWSRPDLITPPLGKVVEIDGLEHKCFSPPEWKVLGHLIVDYRDLWLASVRWEADRASFARDLAAKDVRIQAGLDRAAVLACDRDFWRDTAKALDKHRLELDRRHRSTGWIPWAIVVLEAGFIVVQGFQ